MLKRYGFFILFLSTFTHCVYGLSHHPQEFLQSIRGAKDEGEQIVNHFCINCHAQKPLIAIGAPRIGEKKDWQDRVKLGLAVLLQHTEEGLNGMPPRGGCFECSDEQLELSIISMVPKEAKKALLNDLKAHKKNTE